MRLAITFPCVLLAISTSWACGSRPSPSGKPPRLGYTSEHFERHRPLEERFRASVTSDGISGFHAELTKGIHTSGTPGARAVADYLQRTLSQFGLDVKTFEYQAYLSLPKEIVVDLVAPVREPLRVTEPPSDLDRDTQRSDNPPGYVAYSASGDVTAPIVYANYGLPPDYAELA